MNILVTGIIAYSTARRNKPSQAELGNEINNIMRWIFPQVFAVQLQSFI